MRKFRVALDVDWDRRKVTIQDRSRPSLRLAISFPDTKVKFIGEDYMVLVLTDVQSALLSVAPVDAKGNPAPIEGVVWAVVDPAILTITPSADGLSATIAAVGALGSTQVNVQGDALIGE